MPPFSTKALKQWSVHLQRLTTGALFPRKAAASVELKSFPFFCPCQSSSSGMCVSFLCRPLVLGWPCDHGSAESTQEARVEASD